MKNNIIYLLNNGLESIAAFGTKEQAEDCKKLIIEKNEKKEWPRDLHLSVEPMVIGIMPMWIIKK